MTRAATGDRSERVRVTCANSGWPFNFSITRADGQQYVRKLTLDTPVGFAAIRLRFDVGTDAPQEKLDQLLKLTERYCVVYQTIKNGPPVEVTMRRV